MSWFRKKAKREKIIEAFGSLKMNYHFKVHKDKQGFWAECLEIQSCQTQGETLDEIYINAKEALNLLLDEPQVSKVVFPLPFKKLKAIKNVIEVIVEPSIAFAFLLRRSRLLMGFTQQEMKELLKFKTPFSYHKLEKSKYAKPTLKSLQHIKDCIPDFQFQLLL